ncbi:hypothetical protein ACFX16_035139 [Malus domestica]
MPPTSLSSMTPDSTSPFASQIIPTSSSSVASFTQQKFPYKPPPTSPSLPPSPPHSSSPSSWKLHRSLNSAFASSSPTPACRPTSSPANTLASLTMPLSSSSPHCSPASSTQVVTRNSMTQIRITLEPTMLIEPPAEAW